MITQKELRKYTADHAAVAALDRVLEVRKTDIMKRLDAGEKIEKGALTAQILETSSKRFSAAALVELLGINKVTQLKAQLTDSVSRSLQVISQ